MNCERILRQIRAHPALWGECGEAKRAQAERIRDRAKMRLLPTWKARAEQVQHDRGQRLLYTYS